MGERVSAGKVRCAGSQMLTSATVPSASDPFHHYAATCPECERVFLLPHMRLPVHYRAPSATQPDLFNGRGIQRAETSDRGANLEAARQEMRDTGSPDIFDHLAETTERIASVTHQWRPVAGGFGTSYCSRCGMGEYEATGLVCRGTRSHACPTQSNAHHQGACTRQFDTVHDAETHWWQTHRDAYLLARQAGEEVKA